MEENEMLHIVQEAELKESVLDKFVCDQNAARGVIRAAFLCVGEIGLGQKGVSAFFSFRNGYAAIMFSQAVSCLTNFHPELDWNKPGDGRKSRRFEAELPGGIALPLLSEIGIIRLNSDGTLKGINSKPARLTDAWRYGFCAELLEESGKLSCYEDYKLELILPDKAKALQIAEYFKFCNLNAGVQDDGKVLLRTEAIFLFIGMCGDSKNALEISEFYVAREACKKINRISNFSAANTDKTLTAAAKQYWAITVLIKADKLYSLPAEVVEIARARQKYKELSLGELADMLGISKSTAFHRMKKIIELAEEYRGIYG